jgi:hypothetical protein
MNYEIHITLQVSNTETFIKDCAEIGVKPIVIETQNNNIFENQIMTSSKYSGSHYSLVLNQLVSFFENKKYTILRKKVEIQPELQKNEEHIYYESHIRLKLPKNFEYQPLIELCTETNFHLSKNLFKKDDNYIWQMITYRDYESLTGGEFALKIYLMEKKLQTLNIFYDKIEIEECVYDSNEEIDKSWLNKAIN